MRITTIANKTNILALIEPTAETHHTTDQA